MRRAKQRVTYKAWSSSGVVKSAVIQFLSVLSNTSDWPRKLQIVTIEKGEQTDTNKYS